MVKKLKLTLPALAVIAGLTFGGCSSPSQNDPQVVYVPTPGQPTSPETPVTPELPTPPTPPAGPVFDSPWLALDCGDVAGCEARLYQLYVAGRADYLVVNSMRIPIYQDSPYAQAAMIDEITRDVNIAALNSWKADPYASFHETATSGGFNTAYKYDYRVDVGNGLKRCPCMSSANLRAGARQGVNYMETKVDPVLFSTLKTNQNSQLWNYVMFDK
jgi:hypothetical protein